MMRGALAFVWVSLAVVSTCGFAEARDPSPTPPVGATPPEKGPNQRAWDDLRWLMTALEAYASDNDLLYGLPDGSREGAMPDLNRQLEWYYRNTFPAKPAPPVADPWGRPYRFVISKSRKAYALYSLGSDGKLDAVARTFLEGLKIDRLSEEDLRVPRLSKAVVVASGRVVLAPPDVLQGLRPAAMRASDSPAGPRGRGATSEVGQARHGAAASG